MTRVTLKQILASFVVCLLPTALAIADPPGLKTLPIGAPAPDFRLPGVDGKTHELSDFAAARILVVVFTCNHCPTAQAYEGRLARLQADYRDKGVALVVPHGSRAAPAPDRAATTGTTLMLSGMSLWTVCLSPSCFAASMSRRNRRTAITRQPPGSG